MTAEPLPYRKDSRGCFNSNQERKRLEITSSLMLRVAICEHYIFALLIATYHDLGNVMKKYIFLIGILICLVVAGCGKNKRLTGKVTFSDGTPVKSGMVIFRTDTFLSKGEIKPDGSYKMSSERENDGIPPGEYQVYVSGIFKPPQSGGMPSMPVSLVAPKFENPDTSGLTCKVPAPGNKYDIVLEPHSTNYP